MLDDPKNTEKNYAAKRAVILARVSSKEQEEGYSIDAQKHRLENYCSRHKITNIRTFEIVESSTSGDRRQFMDMIKFVKGQRETIAIVADKVDRVQRSFKEYPLLDELIQKGKIELHFNTENYVIHKNSVSQERLMWSMGVIMAQSYVDSLRDNVRRSIDQKLRLGEFIAMAPIGYLNTRDEKNRGMIIVDPDRSVFVRRLFEEFSKGTHTVSQLTEMSQKWGLKSRMGNKGYLGKSKIYQILNNPFYYGQMIVKGKTYDHRYPPLITKLLFDQCQSVFKRWHSQSYRPRTNEHLLRGLITCSVSGRLVTPDVKKRKYANGGTGQWTYLRCSHPSNPKKVLNVREEGVLHQIERVLQSFTIPDTLFHAIVTHVRKIEKIERTNLRQQLGGLQREHTIIQNRLDGLMDLLLDGIIEKAEFESKKQKLRATQIDMEDQMRVLREGDDKFKDRLIMLIAMLSNAYKLYSGSNVEKKRELLKILFSNLSLKGETLCYTLKNPFDMLVACSGIMQWRTLVDVLRTDRELRLLVLSLPTFNTDDKFADTCIGDGH